MTKLEWTFVIATLLLAVLLGVAIGVLGPATLSRTTSYLPNYWPVATANVQLKLAAL